MPVNRRSIAITDSYRAHLSALVRGADRMARVQWRKLDWANLDRSFLPIHLTMLANVQQAQLEAVRLTSGYLGAYLSSELGERVDPPVLRAADYVGRSVTDRDLSSSLGSPLVKVKVANKGGMPDPMGLGLRTMVAVVDLNVKHAARQSLQDAMEADDRIVGWRRAVHGTCDACMGAADGSTLPPGTPLDIHPNCECVSEAVVRTKSPREAGLPVLGQQRVADVGGNFTGEDWDLVFGQGSYGYFSSPRSFTINNWLRTGDLGENIYDVSEDWVRNMATALDHAIERAGPLGQSVRVFRGVKVPLENLGLEEGQTFADKAFASTSAEERFTMKARTLFDLTVDPRVKALWGANEGEQELLLQRGCRFVVESIEKAEGERTEWRVKAKVLPPE